MSPVTVGDVTHTGFDNISFATKNQLLVVEDAGDSLHKQRNALDSGYVLDLRGKTARSPIRWLAEGRDASATYDATVQPGLQRRRQRDHRHPHLGRRRHRRGHPRCQDPGSCSSTGGASSGPSSTATT